MFLYWWSCRRTAAMTGPPHLLQREAGGHDISRLEAAEDLSVHGLHDTAD